MGKQQPYIPPLIGWLYDLVLWTFSVLIDLFFREVHPRGSWKIPRRGPIIIVAAPHANQVRGLQPAIRYNLADPSDRYSSSIRSS